MNPPNTLPARIAMSLAGIIVAQTGCAHAVTNREVRQTMVHLNREAMRAYEADDFQAALDWLTKALENAKRAGLEGDKLTARTYVHLGAVHLVGYDDEPTASRDFTLAKTIRPNIRMTPAIATPKVRAVFEQAPPASKRDPAFDVSGGPERDLPAIDAPLVCKTPNEWYPHEALTLRCAVRPDLNAKSVGMHYRGNAAFQTAEMQRSPKGWYVATIPGSAMNVANIQVYFEARDGHDWEIATSRQPGNPSVIDVCEDTCDCDYPDSCDVDAEYMLDRGSRQ